VAWPELPYDAWRGTRDTLHLYVQIIGKVRATLTPTEPDWGHAPLYLTARGITTSPIPHPNGVFDIDVDFIDHTVSVRATDGRVETIRLVPRTVAAFYGELMAMLEQMGFAAEISAAPSEVPDAVPFAEDTGHGTYEPEWANRFWHVLVSVDRVLKAHRARFLGKTTPVQLWWGSFDLAYSRYSGRLADAEQWAAGFWPGDERHPQAAFYAYASPKPAGIETAAVEPEAGGWSGELGEFLLPYDAVSASTGPDAALLAFLDSTYRAGASLGGWDPALETSGG
jgi:Family of unknown function (DUF5996)